jgi:two-component system, OmpR family, phosphate regulon response regulator PhoB
MQTVLIIVHEQDQAGPISSNLEGDGYSTILTTDGTHGMMAAARAVPDLILLDMSLRDMPGTEVCRLLKKQEETASIPIIMLNSKTEDDTVLGFEAGADDCLAKPFSSRELLLRVRAILYRTYTIRTSQPCLRAGPITIDADRQMVMLNGGVLICTGIEFKLLQKLLVSKGKVLTREILLKDVWGYSYFEDTRTVDTHITRLRVKLGEAGGLIKTVRGFGYKMAL